MDEPRRDSIHDHFTTLQYAVLSRNPTTVAHILNAGADINRTADHNRSPPLALACDNNDERVANMLIDRGARLGEDVLVTAAYKCVGVLERLLDMGVPVDTLYDSQRAQRSITAPQYVCMQQPCKDIRAVELPLRRARMRMPGQLPILRCMMSNNVAIVRLLIDFGADRDVYFR